MAHRYLYYVLAEPVLSDALYDQLEREAWAVEHGAEVFTMVRSNASLSGRAA